MTDYLLGIDCGLTRTKAVLYSREGIFSGSASLPTDLISSGDGAVELDMGSQWSTAARAVSDLLAQTQIRGPSILAVGLSGYGNGLHILDASGVPVRRAITSMDHRAAPQIESLPPGVQDWLLKMTLQHLWEAQPGILLRWIKKFEPETYRKINHILFCKDWIRFCLTGRINSEFSDMSGSGLMNNSARKIETDLFDALELPEMVKCMPEIYPSTQISGYITPSAASLTGLAVGTPVVNGMFDVVANPIGSGLTSPGRICTIMGTWNVNIALSQTPVTPTLIRQCTIYGDDRYYACIDSSATSASNLTWILQNVFQSQVSFDEFEKIISNYRPENLSVYFMPFVHGGLKPGNPGAAFVGLKSSHTRADMLCAVAEGIAFAHAYHIHNLKLEGVSGREILLTGGASQNKALSQLVANVLQMTVRIPQANETGGLGTCIAAGVGAGCFEDIQTGVDKMVWIREQFNPDPEVAHLYQKKYRRFIEIMDWLSS